MIALDSSVTNEVVVGFEVVLSGVLGVILDATLSPSVTTSFLFWVVEEAILAEAIVGSSVSGVDETVCSVACEVEEEIVLGFSEVTLSIFSEDEDVSTDSISFTLSTISEISEVAIFWVEVVAVESVVTSSVM